MGKNPGESNPDLYQFIREGSEPYDDDNLGPSFPVPGRLLQGSPQQEEFWKALVSGDNHILLDARAGCGKSSSCREGMHRLAESYCGLSIRYTCFNKAIADEFRAGCPRGVDVGTMHSFGFRAIARAFGSKLDERKTYTLLDAMGGPEKGYYRSSIARLVSASKSMDPATEPTPNILLSLALFHDVNLWNQNRMIFEWVDRIVNESDHKTGIIDFDDMLRLPVVYGIEFPKVDFLFIDECQDLSAIQHDMALCLSGTGRTIIVGDVFQSIYMFRGADPDSIPVLQDRLGAVTYPLTVTRRCPRSHVALAQQLVPDFEAAPEAPEGMVEWGDDRLLAKVRPGDMVLCRMNAPLVSRCLQAVASRQRATVRGRAIGESLQAIVRRLGETDTIQDFARELDRWRSKQLLNLAGKDGVENLVEKVMDQAACLEAVASSCGSPAEVPGVINHLFSEGTAANRVTFSSIHRAKGLEADRVFLIDVPYSRFRDEKKPPERWELGQRRNLRYVALTRSKDYLAIIDPDGRP